MTGTDNPPPQQGFEVLSDETRVAILWALAEHQRESSEGPAMGFSDLRRRVGIRDSGNFSYHLGKLEGQFVTKTSAGYQLAPAGLEVVAALITGVYGGDEQLGPLELKNSCPICSEPFTATYENGLLLIDCPNDHVFRNVLPPGAIDERTLEGIIELWTLKTRHDLELAIEKICPYCYAQLDWQVDIEQEFDQLEVETQCPRCSVRIEIPIIVSVCRHPLVAAFYYEHGINVRTQPLWAPEFFDPVEIGRSNGPKRIQIRIELDDEMLKAVLDDSLSIVRVSTSNREDS